MDVQNHRKGFTQEKGELVCELFDMRCCNQYCAAEKQFDGKVAELDLQRYRRHGPDAVTRLMLAELRRWPLQGEEFLDVGSGMGVIGAELAGSGLATATLVDASPVYMDVARGD
jgi:2-polyprenyl-3-methyl-5-hydroxy-6-metoxy-1,4-benzoquinol methylase